MIINRGDILLVDLGIPVGSEQKGRRPFVVMSNDIGNRKGKTITGIPITKQEKPNMPTHVAVPEGLLVETSVILAEQIRTISIQRIVRKVAFANDSLMAQIENALMIQLSLTKSVDYQYLFNTLDQIVNVKNSSLKDPNLKIVLQYLVDTFKNYCSQYNLNISTVKINYKIDRSNRRQKILEERMVNN